MLNQANTSNGAAVAQSIEISAQPPSEFGAHPCFTFRDFLLVLFKYKGVVIGCFLATVVGTLAWLWVRSESYDTSAKIVIKFAREEADPQTALSPNTTRLLPAGKPDINTEAELIKSYALINDVVTMLHLDAPAPQIPPAGVLPRIKFQLKAFYHWAQDLVEEAQILAGLSERLTPKEKAIVRLIRGLKVETVKDSSVVKVTLSSPMKHNAGLVLNTLIDQYRKRRLAVQEISGKAAFFDRETETYKDRLRAAEERLNALKEEYNISSMPEQISLLLKNLSDAKRAAGNARDDVQGDEARSTLLRAQLKQLPPSLMTSQVDSRNAQLDELSNKRIELELERQRLSAKYDEGSVPLQDVDAAIKRVDQLITQTQNTVPQSRTTSVNANYADLEKESLSTTRVLASDRARLAGEEQAAEDYQQQLDRLRKAEIAFNQLSREIALNEETYRLQQRNATEAKISDALNSQGISSIEVVDAAVDPILPTGIRKSYLLGGAIALGLALGGGLAFLFEGLDRTVDSTEDVEYHLGVPLWGSVCRMSRAKLPDLISRGKDDFATLVSRLEHSAGSPTPYVIVVHAANARAGATTITAGLARALEQSRHRTVIIDAANGPILDLLNCRVSPASRDLDLTQGKRANLWDVSPYLSAITFAPGSSGPLEVKAEDVSAAMNRLAACDFVLIDAGSPVSRHVVTPLSHQLGGVLIVTEWRKTRREVLERIREESRRENVKLIAGILNKRRYLMPDFIYSRL